MAGNTNAKRLKDARDLLEKIEKTKKVLDIGETVEKVVDLTKEFYKQKDIKDDRESLYGVVEIIKKMTDFLPDSVYPGFQKKMCKEAIDALTAIVKKRIDKIIEALKLDEGDGGKNDDNGGEGNGSSTGKGDSDKGGSAL